MQSLLNLSFALNLAYLGLARFRYRDQIQKHASRCLSELGDVDEGMADTGWYHTLQRLSLPRVEFKKMPSDQKGEIPNELWGLGYKGYFEKQIDTTLALTFCIGLGGLISLGVAHEVDYLDKTVGYFAKEDIHWWFWGSVAMGAWPALSVLTGQAVVRGAHTFSEKSIANMKKTKQTNVKKAALPKNVTLPQ